MRFWGSLLSFESARLTRWAVAVTFLSVFAADKTPVIVPPDLTIESIGETDTFNVESPFNDCNLTITATSSDPKIATVTPTMIGPTTGTQFTVTAVGLGAATIMLVITTDQEANGCHGGTFNVPVSVKPPTRAAFPTQQAVPANRPNGDPISTATGELYNQDFPQDLSLGGPLPLVFKRYYASLIRANGITTRIGNNWMHNFEYVMTFKPGSATVNLFGGKTVTFQGAGNNWQPRNRKCSVISSPMCRAAVINSWTPPRI